MVGVFYAVLGIVLMVGFHALGAYAVPAGLGPLAAADRPRHGRVHGGDRLLSPEGREDWRCAWPGSGLFVYLGFALLNGICRSLEWNMPVSACTVLLSALIGVPTGFFLIRTIQNCGKRYAKV